MIRKPIIEGPYWIFIYGGEPGWPSKQYNRWQEVINILKDDIQFVQLGVSSHPYPKLENVIDYIGKTQDRNTGIRDLFNIFLHAQGSLGLVSMHMHLSAAFNNPCVVLAAGREPASFTQYYGHQYVHNNGALPCVEQKACWACKLKDAELS
jgi:ADP-heptose:LPS heptosyltransferase